MYLHPSVEIVRHRSFCCGNKYLVTYQYKQALAVVTTRKGFGNSVTTRNSSCRIGLLLTLFYLGPSVLAMKDTSRKSSRSGEHSQPLGATLQQAVSRRHDPQSLDEASRTAPRARVVPRFCRVDVLDTLAVGRRGCRCFFPCNIFTESAFDVFLYAPLFKL